MSLPTVDGGERMGLPSPEGAQATTFSLLRELEMLLVMLVSSLCHTQILVANDNACRLLGYSSHDLIGLKLTQFFLKPDCDVVEALSEEHVEADGHAAVVFGTVVSPGLWTAASWKVQPGEQQGGGEDTTGTEATAAGLALLIWEQA